ncbi:MAG: PAS domain S-box protein [Erythrobacter sp.]|jgi:PAS domain S-box-containing protein|nr:PAS domain S-box protein [Erythrobacter sp.]
MTTITASPPGTAAPALAGKPPVLPDEVQRLAALHALRVLGAPADPGLDAVTRLAADRFDAPIALVSLIDAERQRFKSRYGLAIEETSRNHSFCAHAIASDGVMVVADARKDARFAANPLVLGVPHIRFYAAAPLVTREGYRIGTLCIIDQQPRRVFTRREAQALALMADQAMAILQTLQIQQDQRISQLIAATTSDAFICADSDSRITLWNKAAEAMFGWSAAEALGQGLDLIIPDRHQSGHHAGMARLRAGGDIRLVGKTVEVPARCRAGHEIPVELSLAMWSAHEGHSPEGFAAIIRDVSERKALDERRAETENRLAQKVAAIEATDDGIAITDAGGIFTFMNRAHARMFGYADTADLIGKPWSVLYNSAEAARIEHKAMPVLFEAGQWRGEAVGRRYDGSPIEQEVGLSLSPDGGIVCVTRSIGDRLAAEREKARLREQLMIAQRQEAVGQLASGIAHDFNNLIAAIAGTASLLETSADERVRTSALRILSASTTATQLVEKLLSLGRRETSARVVDLRETLSTAGDLVKTSLADPRHRIEIDIPDQPLEIAADATEAMQVVLNLALNSRDALQPGEEGCITLRLRRAEGLRPKGQVLVGRMPRAAVLIEVSDTGGGIAPGDLAQVFEPFYTRKGDAGTGLGLAVVAGIVSDAGGAISILSRPGEGTVFEIWWPLDANSALAGASLSAEPAHKGALEGKTVLVVDDNADLVDTLVAMLEEAGAEPGPCLDPHDALNAVCEDPAAWDLVITDHDMPGMDGIKLTRWLRAVRMDIPVMLLTALPQAYGRRAGDFDLFDAVLGKPANSDAIISSAVAAINSARRRNP